MNAGFLDRYLERGKQFRFGHESAGNLQRDELLALVGYLSHWAPSDAEVSLEHATDLPPSNEGLLEG